MMPTFIYERDDLNGDVISVTGPEAKHIATVFRLRRGDQLRMTDGRGLTHICEISSASSKKVICRIIKSLKNAGEPGLNLTLAIGLSSSSRFDDVIEKGAESGVARFIPLLTGKGRVKIGDRSALVRKMNRWRRVCTAAVKQSGRSHIPEIAEPISFVDFIKDCDPSKTVLFHPGPDIDDFGKSVDIRALKNLTIVVGPESGFSTAELELAQQRGLIIISLGPRVLRTETAGAVLPALVIYLSEIAKA